MNIRFLLLSGAKRKAEVNLRPKNLKALNQVISQEFPFIEVVAGGGYFYLYSDDTETGLMLASLYTTSIHVYRVSDLTFDHWRETIGFILAQYVPPVPKVDGEEIVLRKVD